MKNGPWNESRTHGVGFADQSVSVSPSKEKLCKAGFLPANHTRVNGFRFYRYAIFVGGVRRPIRVPLLRFRSLGHDRQGPRAVVGSSGAFIRLIQPRPVDAKQEDFRVPRLNYLHKLKATEGFAPPYPSIPWTSPSMDSNHLSGFRNRTAPQGACISRLPCCQMVWSRLQESDLRTRFTKPEFCH